MTERNSACRSELLRAAAAATADCCCGASSAVEGATLGGGDDEEDRLEAAREVGMGGSGAGEENKADDGGDAAALDADFIAFRFRWERKQGGGGVSVCHAPLVSQATLTVQCVLRFFSYKNVTFDRLRSEGKRGRELLSFSVFFF